MLETKRLILRPWQIEDAESCYRYAKNPNIGPKAGWPVHESVENSREIIRTVLSAPNTFAVVWKQSMEPIGNISLMIGKQCNLTNAADEGEIGYWLGEPFWGQGLIPEATKRLIGLGLGGVEARKYGSRLTTLIPHDSFYVKTWTGTGSRLFPGRDQQQWRRKPCIHCPCIKQI